MISPSTRHIGAHLKFKIGEDVAGLSYEDAIQKAGLGYRVETVPATCFAPDGTEVPLNGFRAILRGDTKKPFAVVSDKFKVFQNDEAMALARDLVEAGQAEITRAGALNDGAFTFMMLKLKGEAMNIGGKDPVEKYLTYVNSHDGSSAAKMFVTPFRVFCSNQFRAALKRGEGISVRHTSNGAERLRIAQDAVRHSVFAFESFERTAEQLVNLDFSGDEMMTLVERILPAKAIEEDGRIVQQVSPQLLNARNTVIDLMSTGAGHQEAGIVGTAWGAWNAVGEYVDHHRGTRLVGGGNDNDRATSRTQTAWFGPGAGIKENALEIIKEIKGLKK